MHRHICHLATLLLFGCGDGPVSDVSILDAAAAGDGDTPPPCAETPPPDYHRFEIDSVELMALEVDPLLAGEPYCDGPGNCGTGDAVPRSASRFVVSRERAPRGQLFVYLGGSGGTCRTASQLLQLAAFAGFRALCLGYPNEVSVADRCRDHLDDESCPARVRAEIVTGIDSSPVITIGRRNSIEGRLVAMIRALDAARSGVGFSAFLDGDSPRWERIVIAGFSQGGGHAGWIAGTYSVARAIYLSKSADAARAAVGSCATEPCTEGACSEGTCYAATLSAWTLEPRATDPSREYGFVHRREDAFQHSPNVWRAWGLDLSGDLVDVDSSAAPYGCSHMLLTDVEPAVPEDFHRSMAGDPWMAVDAAGLPVNSAAYLHMMMSGW